MTVLYVLSDYHSHHRAGLAACALIRAHPSVTLIVHDALEARDRRATRDRDIAAADIVILHIEPHDFGSIYEQYPALRHKYVIGRCVWEADLLPETYRQSIAHIQEIWVPSTYCRTIFAREHPRVTWMPHPIGRDMPCTDDDRRAARARIAWQDGLVYYLTIAKLRDKRKNTQTLIDAFSRQRGRMPNARLIIKASTRDLPFTPADPRIIVIRDEMTEAEITALYECADVYVSAHHAEGWGWTLADALCHRKPTIATGYSGNLDFMHAGNSFLLNCTEEYIRDEDLFGAFAPGMKWGYPEPAHLEEQLLCLYDRQDRAVRDMIAAKAAASADVSRYSPAAVGALTRARLDEVYATWR